jgi:hypothetical protein
MKIKSSFKFSKSLISRTHSFAQCPWWLARCPVEKLFHNLFRGKHAQLQSLNLAAMASGGASSEIILIIFSATIMNIAQ